MYPVLFILISEFIGFITPNYNWRKNYISELSTLKYGWWQKLNFLICGVSIATACMLLSGQSETVILRISLLLASVMGVFIVMAGVWDTDYNTSAKTMAGRIHGWVYQTGIFGVGITYILMGFGFIDNIFVATVSWATALVSLVWWKYSYKINVPKGIGQRFVIYLAILWFEVLGIWTLM